MIWWGTTRHGKAIPLEEDGWARPSASGAPMWDENGNQFHGAPVGSHIPGAIKMFRPHFLYCPYAAQMRKPKPKKTDWEIAREKARAEAESKKAEAEAKRAERERIERAREEFEARQVTLF